MEIENKKVVEIFLGIILVVLLIIMSVLIMSIPSSSQKPSQTITISNSFNTINIYPEREVFLRRSERIEECQEYSRQIPFSSRKEYKRVKAIFGNEVDRYYVYIKNLGHRDGYFTVKFYFTDYYGKTKTYFLTKHIKAKEEIVFMHQNVYEGKYGVWAWDYEVISHSKETFYC